MVITEQETEKKVEPNYFSSQNYGTETDYSNYSNTFSNYTSPTYIEEDDEPAFSVESEYNTNDNPSAEVNPYRVVTPSFITVNRQHETQAQNEVIMKKQKLSPRLKIALTVTSLVFVLLVAFVIYNAIAIGNLNREIANATNALRQEEMVITSLENEYNGLGTAESIRQGLSDNYVYADESNTYYLSMPELDAPTQLEAPNNWFNSICEFFARLF